MAQTTLYEDPRTTSPLLCRASLEWSRLKDGEVYRECNVLGHAPVAKFTQTELAFRSFRPLLRKVLQCLEL